MGDALTTAVVQLSPERATLGDPSRPATTRSCAEATVVGALGAVSVLNYAYTLLLVWLLPSSDYAVVGSASALLLICGTVSTASMPWVLAREVAVSPEDASRRQAAVTFCGLMTAGEALASGVVVTAIASHYSGNATMAAIFGSVVAIFTAATAVGYLQGLQRFHLIATLRITEVVVKMVTGAVLVRLGAGAAGAVAGFGLGALVVAGAGFLVMAPDVRLPTSWRIDRGLARHAAGLVSIQGGVAVLVSVDVVTASLALTDRSQLATYQVAQVLTRVPVFIGAALSMVAFPRLTVSRGDAARVVSHSLALFARITVPVAFTVATIPPVVVGHMIPNRYGDVGRILAWGAAGGALMGAVNLVTTFFQSVGDYRRPAQILAYGVLAQIGVVLLGLHLAGAVGMAASVAVGGAATCVVLIARARRRWPGCTSGLARQVIMAAVLAAPLMELSHKPILWAAWLVVGGALPATIALSRLRSHPAADAAARPRRRVLHLGYEDPCRPGSGGGSIRTHAINKRLASEFDITVVCARYKGATPRVEDGVRYVHIGLPFGRFTSVLAYFATIPYALVRYPSDLVVEDFGAPFSTIGVPWMTGRPVVGVVQWLFARDKARQYHLPFHLVESAGLRAHRQLVAVSEELATTLRQRNRRATVVAVQNGLEDDAFRAPSSAPRANIVYLGRLEIAQKGLDLLLAAFAEVAHQIDADLVIGGDGPDRPTLEAAARRLRIAGRVRFVGRVDSADRLDFLAGAALVAMPSRFESFGMVAAEALAVGTPVVAFDIPCLRALVTPETGELVPSFRTDLFGRALCRLMHDPERRDRIGRSGPASLAPLRWDLVADQQGAEYRRALAAEAAEAPATQVPQTSTSAPARRGDPQIIAHVPPGVGPNPGEAVRAAIAGRTRRRRAGRRVRVLALGNYGAGNTGDEAVLAGLAEWIALDADITVLSRDPRRVTRLHGVRAARMTSLGALRALLATDVVAVGGGGMFGRGLPPLVAVLPAVLLVSQHLLRKRVVLMSLGVYPDTPATTRRMLQLVARSAVAVHLRDERSIATMKKGRLGRHVEARLVGDPAVFMTPDSPERARHLLAQFGVRPGEKPLVLSVKPTPDPAANERVVAALAEVASWWAASFGDPVVVVPLSAQGDYGLGVEHRDEVLGEQIRAAASHPDRVVVLPGRIKPRVAKALFGEASAVIGMRFHALVFSVCMRRPTLGLVFEHKAAAWLDQVGGAQIRVADANAGDMIGWLTAVRGAAHPQSRAVGGPGPVEQAQTTFTPRAGAGMSLNTIPGTFKSQTSFALEEIRKLRDGLDVMCREEYLELLASIARSVVDSLERGGSVFFCGNGGSAADAQHLAAELVGRQNYDRPPAAGIALTVDTSALTALGNDYGYEAVFARQIQAIGRPGDVLFGLSTSGRSANVVAALDAARAKGLTTVVFTGADARDMSRADLVLSVPSHETAKIQELHITSGHIVFGLVEQLLFPRVSLGVAETTGPNCR
jgi:phosphoheptose isomerase/glycosyltransferase involved in cell wall biosynthesis/O-antigen/teichoic acid export membrane protein/polysaccharide pyruvyl transferase WcaK-like protein